MEFSSSEKFISVALVSQGSSESLPQILERSRSFAFSSCNQNSNRAEIGRQDLSKSF
jgi:hypothetical protein